MTWQEQATPVEAAPVKGGWQEQAIPAVEPATIRTSRYETSALADRINLIQGIADVGVVSAPAAVGTVLGAGAGLMALALTGDPDYAKERLEKWQTAWTFDPMTDEGESVINAIAPPLSVADTKISDYAAEQATFIGEDGQEHIDPVVATAIKTAIWGAADIVTAAIPATKGVLNNLKINSIRNAVVKDARRLGIDIHLDNFRNDVAAAAKMVGSESAGEQAEQYVLALRSAEKAAKKKKKSRYATAAEKSLFVTTSPIRKMGMELTRKLDAAYDLDGPQKGMPLVRRTLDDMHSRRLGFGSGQNLAVHFSQFEKLRKRINTRITDTTGNPKYASANSALIKIKAEIDDWMINEFNNASIRNGQIIANGGALSGDAAGYDAYMAARASATEHAWFKDTKVIADIIKKDASIDEVAAWVIGATPMGKRGAARVVNKMKVLLGEDHPSIEALRADFIYNLTAPLLQTEPNFNQFAKNFDLIMRKNKPLVDAFGLQQSDVALLADYALVSKQLPASGKFYSVREIIATVSRLTVGHGVAKGAARVTFMTKVLNAIGAVDKVSRNQIIDAIGSVSFDNPMITSKNPIRAGIIAGAAVSDIATEDK